MIKKIRDFVRCKKAQLALLETRYLLVGVVIGLILGVLAVYLSSKGVLPSFIKSMACVVAKTTK